MNTRMPGWPCRCGDDILVSAAGPAMNFLIAVALLVVAKGAQFAHYRAGVVIALELAHFSLFLCFFNLLPIPPLDGAHILENLVGISDETYRAISQFSFLFMIWMMRIPAIGAFVNLYTNCVLAILAWPLGGRLME